MTISPAPRSWFRIPVIAGVILLILGVLFTLQNFGVLSLGDVQLGWPLLVVAFGLSRIVERSGRLQGLVLLAAGVGVQLSNLGFFFLPAHEAVRYWPLIVVLVGLWVPRSSEAVGAKVEGAAIALLGAWLQMSYFGVVHISSYRTWPLGLAAVGAVLLGRGIRAGRGAAR